MPDANLLDNCFGEKNPYFLQEHETFFSGLRIRELIDAPLTGKFDYDHLLRIHAYIFQDLYPGWAGTTRTIPMAKKERLLQGKSVQYAHPGKQGSKIESAARVLFNKLEQDSYLQDQDRREYCEGLALFLSKLWQLHPFREGNTRTIMVMCYHITRQAGYHISLKYVDNMHKDLRASLVISTLGDLQKLEDFLFAAIGDDDRDNRLCRNILARLRS
jgi:cell filamentation protein